MTKWQLFGAMVNKLMIQINHHSGRIMGIELEDGSGSSFNVSLLTTAGKRKTVYVRTVD